MDQISDFGNFQRLMRRLCETMGKPITDELVESWWKALRTVRFAEIERRMEAFMARASDTTRFPRPGQFVPPDVETVADPKDEARDRRMSEDNARNWSAFIAEFPTTGPLRKRMAEAARLMATERESSPAYAEAKYEYFACEKLLGDNGRFSADR